MESDATALNSPNARDRAFSGMRSAVADARDPPSPCEPTARYQDVDAQQPEEQGLPDQLRA
eukprot:5484718-Lingulodinium_polyedra.AAC.1